MRCRTLHGSRCKHIHEETALQLQGSGRSVCVPECLASYELMLCTEQMSAEELRRVEGVEPPVPPSCFVV